MQDVIYVYKNARVLVGTLFLPAAPIALQIILIVTVLGIPCAIVLYCVNKKTRRRTQTGGHVISKGVVT